jgi:4'-phosphopantetheinyl transferase
VSDFFLQSKYIEKDRVDIWQTSLIRSSPEIEKLASSLNIEERSRADKFKSEIHRNRFIVARGVLRQILSLYLDLNPNKIEFIYSDRGKPYLSDNHLNLQFNLSHSEDLAVYAITQNKKIGIDVEYINSNNDYLGIARRFFSAKEVKTIEAVTKTERSQLFFQFWTAKEAYLKATGEGLSGSLDKVEINFDQEKYIYTINSKNTPNWQLYQFNPTEKYLATVAVEIEAGKILIVQRNYL